MFLQALMNFFCSLENTLHQIISGVSPLASGDIAGTPGCKITGPEGEIEISEGVIVAKRHIHLVPETAEKWGVKNKDVVSVKVDSDGRKAILGDVVIRVSENFADAMHIDTDESNAVMAAPGMMVEVIK